MTSIYALRSSLHPHDAAIGASFGVKLPNFFIVGAAKAGTTSLYRHLRAHPQVYMSPIKEPHYFSKEFHRLQRPTEVRAFVESALANDGPNENDPVIQVSSFEDYSQLFSRVAEEPAIGEASTSYLYSVCAAAEIRAVSLSAKIIIVLRHPVERAFSHYLNDVRAVLRKDSFGNELQKVGARDDWKVWGMPHPLVQMGMYFEQVKRYLDIFPREQVKILLYDDLKRDAGQFVREVYSFLGVDPDFQAPMIEQRFNASTWLPRFPHLEAVLDHPRTRRMIEKIPPLGVRRRLARVFYTKKIPRMRPREREMLLEIFRPDVLKLQTLIDRDLSAWLT